jgi:hypothetical protein
MNLFNYFRKRKNNSAVKRRVYVDNPRYYTQLYASSEFRAAKYTQKDLKVIKKRQRKGRLQKIFSGLKSLFLTIFLSKIILMVLPFFFVLGAITVFKNYDFFSVKNIIIIGNDQIGNEEIFGAIAHYQGRNLFNFSVDEVEVELENSIALVKKAYVRKYLPDKLEVEIVEREPSMIIITLKAMHIIDNDNVVIEQQDVGRFDLISFEQAVIKGEADINDLYVQEQYYLNLNPKEGEDLPTWDKVPAEEKQKIFDRLKSETLSKVESFLSTQTSLVPERYKELPIVFFSTDQKFPLRQKIKDEQIAFSNEALVKLKNASFRVDRIVWISQFSAEFVLIDDRVLVLSRLRDLEEQIQDLLLLLEKVPFENFTRFDVRVPTIAVE